MEAKEFLINVNKSHDWETSEDSLKETLFDYGKDIHTETIGQHRWYDDIFVVTEIEGQLLCYNWYYCTGDNSPADMDLELDWGSVRFAEKYQKTIDAYRPVND